LGKVAEPPLCDVIVRFDDEGVLVGLVVSVHRCCKDALARAAQWAARNPSEHA
jgi:hypothetical protein